MNNRPLSKDMIGVNLVHGLVLFVLLFGSAPAFGQSITALLSKSDQWFSSHEATRIAENVLLYQRNAGGWVKSNDYFKEYSESEKQKISYAKVRRDCTFDNDATHTELSFLARLYSATKDNRYRDAFYRGLDLIFDAQYENGGWPQFYPETDKMWSWDNSQWSPEGLEHFITYNDDAIVGILWLLKRVAESTGGYSFVDAGRSANAAKAVEKGISCILKSQFYYEGKRTAWPAQVDEVTFAPKWARTFEPPSIASRESISIIRFLMSIERPDAKIISSVQSAVKWLNDVKIQNIKLQYGDTTTVIEEKRGVLHRGRRDVTIVEDKRASALWARFYELNTFRPVFCSRDDTVRYALADISLERRSGYAWYGDWGQKLLSIEYPAWCKKYNVENIFGK
jgi:PelA/Pel-15E family pectate lyase